MSILERTHQRHQPHFQDVHYGAYSQELERRKQANPDEFFIALYSLVRDITTPADVCLHNLNRFTYFVIA